MSKQAFPNTIYTVGHSNLSIEQFLRLLAQHGIEVVVDVRSAPYSRYTPHFNHDALASTLKQMGIEHRYAGEYLGGRPKDPTCYKNGQLPDGKADYLKLVDYQAVATRPWYQKGIARLLEIATDKTTALLCSEEDPHQCHRHHLIAQSLIEKGISVEHIRGNGSAEKALSLAEERESQSHQMSFID